MRARKGLVGFFAAAGTVLVAASVAWACVLANGPVMEAQPQRAPVLAGAVVTGGSWQPSTPIEVGWATSPGVNVQHLAAAQTDGSGNLSVPVQVPQVAPGFYYIVLTQGTMTQARPFEVLGAPGQATLAQTVAPATDPATGQAWSGLRANGTQVQGLSNLPAHHGSSAPWMAIGIAGGVTVLFGGLALAEVRRRRVAAHAEIRS